jgi:hypothetical protein
MTLAAVVSSMAKRVEHMVDQDELAAAIAQETKSSSEPYMAKEFEELFSDM